MTAEPSVPFPASPYCRVRARVASIWADGPDDGTHPDWRPAAGERVTLTPSIGSQLLTYDAAGDNPIIVTVERVECVVSADGWLTKNDGRPVYIAPTDDPLLSATGWTWTASIKGKTVPFAAPSGGVVDLAVFIAAPATDDTKVWVERLPEMVTAGATALDAAAVAVAARDTATGAASTATGAASTATAARDATLAASTIVGAGRPDVPASMAADVQSLVSAATSGAVFRSTDGPQGAWEWRKRGSTWVCVEGDTGWRTIPVTGVTADAYGARIRRVGDRVEAIIDRITFAADFAAGTDVVPYPPEFGPSIGLIYLPKGAAYGTPRAASAYPAGIRFHEAGALANFRASYTWIAVSAWPTTLPGTPG